MEILGNLEKMRTEIATPVQYKLHLGEETVYLNKLLGKKISLNFTGQINCIQCGRKINKSFQQGYCFPCLQRLQECNLCMIHPEKCNYYKGGCNPNDWVHSNCGQNHIIYLANSSGLKVGITRSSQIPTRWIDQGATQALPIFEVSNRYQAGTIEMVLKSFVADKTDWRKMLKGIAAYIDLINARDEIISKAIKQIEEIAKKYSESEIARLENQDVTTINYPVLEYPTKFNSLSFDKTSKIDATLLGIKGQYLIFDIGVINIRKFGGYKVEFSS